MTEKKASRRIRELRPGDEIPSRERMREHVAAARAQLEIHRYHR